MHSRSYKIALEVWADKANDAASLPPSVEIIDDDKPAKRRSGSYVYRRTSVTNSKEPPKTAKERARVSIIEEKLKAIIQVLVSFELLDGLTKEEQEALLFAIYKILEERDE